MTPEAIRELLAQEKSELHVERIQYGFSFWWGTPNPQKTNRIIRVKKDSPTAPTRLKLAATDNLNPAQRRTQITEFAFNGGPSNLLAEVAQEIAVYRQRTDRATE